ncbi:MAG: restriction endonuclease subunit S [Clostridia bacterium]|nr:restriction endonuclease subunit S [Clostridia bacterium]
MNTLGMVVICVPKVRFGDVVQEVKHKIDRNNNPYEFYVAGDHMDTADLTIHRHGCFATDDVGPAFVREFKKGQVLYGSRRTYLKKVAVADFDGVTANTTFVLETKNPDIFLQSLLPFVMLTDSFTEWSVKRSKGSTNPYVLFSDLADFEFELPNIEEQRRVSDVLWASFHLRERYEGLIQQCDALVQSQFVEMFGDAAIDVCCWPVERMDSVFSITSSSRILKSEWKSNGNIPFIRVRDMVQLANGEPLTNEFFVSEEFYNSRPEEEKTRGGDIIVSATSTIGKTYVIKDGERFYFKDADVLLFRKKKPINGTFFTYGLNMPTLWNQIESGLGSTTVAHFLISKACKLLQPMPPMELQERFATIVDQTDKSKLAIRQALESLEKSRKAIMTKIFG